MRQANRLAAGVPDPLDLPPMNANIERIKLIFIGVFAVICVGLVVWQVGWIGPQKKCEAGHGWWDNGHRVCGRPVLITTFTHRPIEDKAAEAAARAAIGLPAAPR
jgi:hypothetical protein